MNNAFGNNIMKKIIFTLLLLISSLKGAHAEFAAQGEFVADYGAWIEARYILRGDLEHDNRPMAMQTSGSCPCDIELGSWGTYADGNYGAGNSHIVSFDTHSVRLTERSTWDEKPVTFSEVARALEKGNLLNKKIQGRWQFYPRRPGVGFCFNLGILYRQKMQIAQTANNPIILCSPLDPTNISCNIEGPDYLDHGTLSNSSLNGDKVSADFRVSCTETTDVKITATAGLDGDNFIFIADGLESEINIDGSPETTLRVDAFTQKQFQVSSQLIKTKDIPPNEYSGIFLLSVEIP